MSPKSLFLIASALATLLLTSCSSQRLNLSRVLKHVDPRTLEVHPDRYWSTDGSVYLSVVEEIDSCRARYALIRTADDSVLSYIDSILVDPEFFIAVDGMVVIDEFLSVCRNLPSNYRQRAQAHLLVDPATGQIRERSKFLMSYIGSDGTHHFLKSHDCSTWWSCDRVFAYDRATHERTVFWTRTHSDSSAPIAILEDLVVIRDRYRSYSDPPILFDLTSGLRFEYVEGMSRDTLYLGPYLSMGDLGALDVFVVGSDDLLLTGSELLIWVHEMRVDVFEVNKLLFDKGELYPERFDARLTEWDNGDDIDYYSTRDVRRQGDDRIIASVARRSGLGMHEGVIYPLALFEINLGDHSVRLLRMIEE